MLLATTISRMVGAARTNAREMFDRDQGHCCYLLRWLMPVISRKQTKTPKGEYQCVFNTHTIAFDAIANS